MSISLLQPYFLMSKTKSYAQILIGSRLFLTAMAIHLSLRVAPLDLHHHPVLRTYQSAYLDVPVQRNTTPIYDGIVQREAKTTMVQTKVKRPLAHSSIGHVGYIRTGFSCGTIEGIQSLLARTTRASFPACGSSVITSSDLRELADRLARAWCQVKSSDRRMNCGLVGGLVLRCQEGIVRQRKGPLRAKNEWLVVVFQ